jgi:5-(carboxyamino)imidazole ribonucleotide mutase
VATVAIGGAKNAAVLATQIIGVADGDVAARLHSYKQELAEGLKL